MFVGTGAFLIIGRRRPLWLVLVVLAFVMGTAHQAFAVDKADVPRLIRQLGDRDVLLRRQAADLLSRLGPDAQPAIPALIKALRDEDIFVKRFAAKALGSIGPEAKAAIPQLAQLLRHEDAEVSDAAAEALGRMGPDAVAPLIAALQENDIYLKRQAVRALGQLGPEAAPAVPALIETFKSLGTTRPLARRNITAAEVRVGVVQTLGAIGPAAKAAVPVLREVLQERVRDRGLRQVINQALRKIERPEK
jgi:HEAT repeat protein